MNIWLKKLKVKAILPAAALIAAAAIETTFAWQKWELEVTNQLKAHDTSVTVEEEFDKDNPFEHKKVKFTNTGSSSVFLRVSYTEYWEGEDGANQKYLLSNSQDGQNVAVKHWTQAWENEWTEIGGWYYYNKILKSGNSTDEILSDVDLVSPLPAGYENADYHLFFKAEAVQCSDGSNTLNSDEVNQKATSKIFGVSPPNVNYTTGAVTWPN